MTRMNEANKVFEAFKPESNRICPSFSWQRYEPLPAIHHLSHYSRKRPGSGNSSAECAEMCRESKSRKGIWKGLELSSRPQSSAHSLLYSRRAGGTSSLAFGASVTVQTLMSKPLFFFSTTFLDGVVAFSLGLIGFFPSTRSTDLIWTTKSSLLGGVGGGGMTLAPLAFEAATASGVTSCDSISTVTLPPEPGAFASMERYTTFFADPLSTERICVLTATPGTSGTSTFSGSWNQLWQICAVPGHCFSQTAKLTDFCPFLFISVHIHATVFSMESFPLSKKLETDASKRDQALWNPCRWLGTCVTRTWNGNERRAKMWKTLSFATSSSNLGPEQGSARHHRKNWMAASREMKCQLKFLWVLKHAEELSRSKVELRSLRGSILSCHYLQSTN